MERYYPRELDMYCFQDVNWDPERKPVIVTSDNWHSIKDLSVELNVPAAYVVGVNQKTFDTMCEYLRTPILHFYEMRVEDLSALKMITALRHLAIRWNTKIKSLDFLKFVPTLESLILEDTKKVADLDPISKCLNLRHLEFSGGFWNKNQAESLEPFVNLECLESLALGNLTVSQGGLVPIGKLKNLKRLEVSNQFDIEDYARLKASNPEIECEKLYGYSAGISCEDCDGETKMITGKRRPFVCAECEPERLAKYKKKFDDLVQMFRNQ